jgi:transcriptional regulator with XRE-family HTH domain
MATRIGENICKLRKQSNLTQQQLSDIIGVSIAAISKWETGAAHPDIELLPKIATIFDVSIDYIFDYHLSLYDNSMKVIDNAKQLFDSGQHYRAISMLSEALLRYPNDIFIKFNRAQMMIYSSVKPPIDFDNQMCWLKLTEN